MSRKIALFCSGVGPGLAVPFLALLVELLREDVLLVLLVVELSSDPILSNPAIPLAPPPPFSYVSFHSSMSPGMFSVAHPMVQLGRTSVNGSSSSARLTYLRFGVVWLYKAMISML